MQKQLTVDDLNKLRAQGLVSNDETAYWVGDKLVAENVLTRERKVIEAAGLVLESKKRLIKG